VDFAAAYAGGATDFYAFGGTIAGDDLSLAVMTVMVGI
jgi:hypothetical protein